MMMMMMKSGQKKEQKKITNIQKLTMSQSESSSSSSSSILERILTPLHLIADGDDDDVNAKSVEGRRDLSRSIRFSTTLTAHPATILSHRSSWVSRQSDESSEEEKDIGEVPREDVTLAARRQAVRHNLTLRAMALRAARENPIESKATPNRITSPWVATRGSSSRHTSSSSSSSSNHASVVCQVFELDDLEIALQTKSSTLINYSLVKEFLQTESISSASSLSNEEKRRESTSSSQVELVATQLLAQYEQKEEELMRTLLDLQHGIKGKSDLDTYADVLLSRKSETYDQPIGFITRGEPSKSEIGQITWDVTLMNEPLIEKYRDRILELSRDRGTTLGSLC